MKFISINGSTCSGKSTVCKNISKQRGRLFYLSYDAVKWSFSKYSPDTHAKDVHALLLSMTQAVCEMKYDIISDSGLHREWREKLLAVPRAHGYDIIEINLEADYNVLSQRFDERVARAIATPEKMIANLSKDRFKELFDIFQKEKNPAAITFRTDTQTMEEVSESILKFF
jgi:predicted kinase